MCIGLIEVPSSSYAGSFSPSSSIHVFLHAHNTVAGSSVQPHLTWGALCGHWDVRSLCLPEAVAVVHSQELSFNSWYRQELSWYRQNKRPWHGRGWRSAAQPDWTAKALWLALYRALCSEFCSVISCHDLFITVYPSYWPGKTSRYSYLSAFVHLDWCFSFGSKLAVFYEKSPL